VGSTDLGMIDLMLTLTALVLALILCGVARRVGFAIGAVDRPSGSDLKIHARPVSLLGGVAVVLAILGALGSWQRMPPSLVIGAVLVALGGGLVDDVRPLPPAPRLVLLASSGVLLALEVHPAAVAAAGVILLVLACANAVNLVDGQDALAGGLGVLASLGLAGVSVALGVDAVTDLSLALVGALAGFLLWNRPPARIFLGNGGAYAVGAILAAASAMIVVASGWQGLLACGMVLGFLVFEACFTVARRLIAGGVLTQGDRLHSYDLLTVRLGSRVRSTFVVWAIASAAAGLGVAMARLPVAAAVLLALIAVLAASVFGLLLWRGRPTSPRQSGAVIRST
jgi:UDP-GlcNAc:undecaprenyl-phosphate/decaprenyl-phosphate GlcNAc-1-phosphate transferase